MNLPRFATSETIGEEAWPCLEATDTGAEESLRLAVVYAVPFPGTRKSTDHHKHNVPVKTTTMPYTVTFDQIPVGYAAAAAKDGNTVPVQYIGFTSTEDGQRFIKLLEGIPDDLLRLLAQQCSVMVSPSQVDHIVAIIKRDRTATVYLNELRHTLTIRASRPIKAGEAVTKNDIADINQLNLESITIPPDAGVVYLFSIGWRKGLFFDFGPLNPTTEVRRDYDCARLFTQLYASLLFQERFRIQELEWDILFAAQMFPFAGLKNETIQKMLGRVRAGWKLSELSETIVAEVQERVPSFIESWRKQRVFTPHMPILECAAQRFSEKDYISSTGLLLPRIEGILRSHHVDIGRTDSPKQAHLADSAIAAQKEEGSLLLPQKFRDYIERVFFAGFSSTSTPCDSTISVSRHSVAHGVAPPESFTAMQAAISFLVLHQLYYFFLDD